MYNRDHILAPPDAIGATSPPRSIRGQTDEKISIFETGSRLFGTVCHNFNTPRAPSVSYQMPARPGATDPDQDISSHTVNFGTDAMIAAGINYVTDLANAGYRRW